LERQLAPRYVLLANEFQKIGDAHFKAGRFNEALQTFEQALQITRNPLLSLRQDLNLLYNTALAAYEAKEHDKAIEYLSQLNAEKYSPNVAHLLFTMYMEKGDTLAAKGVLVNGVEKYEKNEDLVLLLADQLQAAGETKLAIEILDREFEKNPTRHIFPYTKGLILQKAERYTEAIEAYNIAVPLAENNVMIYINIATCYYNIGVEIEENARYLTNNTRVLEERAKSLDAFNNSGQWLDKAYDKRSGDPAIMLRLFQLYRSLGRYDKVRSIQGQIN
jgi:tetratricopeptide (TPR) repeat protein